MITEAHVQYERVVSRARNISTLIKGATWVAVAYFAYLSVKELAGQVTSAEFVLSILGIPWARTLLLLMLLLTLIGWALIERDLRRRKTRELSNRVTELEKSIDQNRTSSGLTPEGDTHPRDVL